jgi:hypothetical protein
MIREQKEKKKLKKKENQLKKKEEELKKREEELKKKEEETKQNPKKQNNSKKEKIPWPTSNSKNNETLENNNTIRSKRNSVNIESKRKESKRLLSNFKVENNDKTYWNSSYPIIEYPE